MKKLNVAIIGQGRSGRDIHGYYFRSENNTHYEVVAVVDQLEHRRKRAAEEYHCDVYEDYHALLDRKDIDLVVNSSYSCDHYPITLDLLNHGFNVVTEKPFAVHAADCDDMIRAAKENGVMLCVFQQSHFAPYYRKVREIVDSGVLGRLIEIKIQFSGWSRRWDWQCSQRFGGGCLRNTGPHPMEQALDLLDSDEMPTVASRLDLVNSFGDAEDFAKVVMMLPGKPVIDVEISSCNKHADFTYLIEGSQGSMKATMKHVNVQYMIPAEAPEQKLILDSLEGEDGTPRYCKEQLTWHEIDEDIEGTAFDVGAVRYYENIYQHLTEGEPLVIRPEKIRQMVAVMEEVHRQNPFPVKY